MRGPTSLLLVLATAALAAAAPPAVKFPVVPPAVSPPAPPAVATPVAVVTGDRLFVIESKDPVTPVTSPDGLVKVTRESGPLTVYARFADGTGDRMERRTFAGPHVFLVEPLKSGECELLIVPERVTGEGDIVRRPLRVDAGTGPQPPPAPPSDPLAVRAAELFRADPSPTKAADAAKLAAVYRQLVQSAVDDPGLTTPGRLLAVAADAARQVAPLPALKAVREAFADELDAKLGKNPAAALTPALRATAKEQFTRLATVLETLK